MGEDDDLHNGARKEQHMETSETLVVRLRTDGLLLQQDPQLPNVVTLVAGAPVRGSWWAHPAAQRIFVCLKEVTNHPDVLATRLVLGKITFVHRRLWSAVLAVACSHSPWQIDQLSPGARNLYEDVERQGTLLASGPWAKEIMKRLLVHDEEIHTPAGHHERLLESWLLWAERVECPRTLTSSEGQQQLEAALRSLGGSAVMLPWGKH
jgi:hypothetical protein